MQGWQTTDLGLRELPRELSAFELRAYFTFSRPECKLIEARGGEAPKLGLALHIGFLRMSGRLLDAVRIVPPALWRHLGSELGIDAPRIASLRAMYGRGRTLFDHQQVACDGLGFRWMSEHQRRALVRLLSDQVLRCADRAQLLAFARRWPYEHRVLIVHDRAIRSLIAAALVHLEAEETRRQFGPKHEIDHASTPLNANSEANRKRKQINSLRTMPGAGTRSPTVTYCSENESTPITTIDAVPLRPRRGLGPGGSQKI